MLGFRSRVGGAVERSAVLDMAERLDASEGIMD